MSGGSFDYNQYKLEMIADEIENIIENNEKETEWGYKIEYTKETIKKFQFTINRLRETSKMVQRIDWLVSGDDGENDFHERWKNEKLPEKDTIEPFKLNDVKDDIKHLTEVMEQLLLREGDCSNYRKGRNNIVTEKDDSCSTRDYGNLY